MAASSAYRRSGATNAGRYLVTLATALFLTACAVPLKYTMQATPHLVAVEDLRPALDKSTDYNPRNIGFYGAVWGDERFSPARLTVLKNRLSAEVGDKLQGKVLRVTRLRTVQFQTRPMNVDLLLFGDQPHHPAAFGITDPERYPEWFVCQIEASLDGSRLRGVGTAGYALFFSASEVATSTLMTAIDQIIEQIQATGEDLRVSAR